jgi:hypothetical protein
MGVAAGTVEILMKIIAMSLVTLIASGAACCYAVDCSCDDWMEKGGYCVDYVKDRIPTFQIPYKDDMPALNNVERAEVEEGDVAIFSIKNYWHVAYVEKVHRDQVGKATAIDVSEKNFGDELSFAEFKSRWNSNSRYEWNRAVYCGITDNFDRITRRQYIPLDTVKQLWSPNEVAEGILRRRLRDVADKVREKIESLLRYTQDKFQALCRG